MRGTVLVVDDQAGARQALAAELEDAGFAVVEACDGIDAWDRFRTHGADLVITDMVMPRADGIDLLARIRARSEVPVIVFTAYGSVDAAVAALKSGADEFVSSTDLDADGLVAVVRRVLEAPPSPAGLPDLASRLIGRSALMGRVREQLSGLAPLRVPVLVRGEAGSGRDTVVRALHELGSSSGGGLALIRWDSADREPDTVGDSGALYLDGIERFSSRSCERWTRFLVAARRSRFRRGPRLLASTTPPKGSGHDPAHDALLHAVGRFRVALPPLRERGEDIAEIVEALVPRIGAALGRPRVRVSGEALRLLEEQPWPGNVRQLQRVLERAIGFSRSGGIRRRDVERVLAESRESIEAIRTRHEALELETVLRAVRATGGNISRAAERLGRSRAAIYRVLARHGVPLGRNP